MIIPLILSFYHKETWDSIECHVHPFISSFYTFRDRDRDRDRDRERQDRDRDRDRGRDRPRKDSGGSSRSGGDNMSVGSGKSGFLELIPDDTRSWFVYCLMYDKKQSID